jgi:hypothetical protein
MKIFPTPVLADLVGDPGLVGARGEGVAHPPQHLSGEYRQEGGDQALDQHAGADQYEADDDRQPAAVQISDDAGRDLEREAGDFEGGSDQNHLQQRRAASPALCFHPGLSALVTRDYPPYVDDRA